MTTENNQPLIDEDDDIRFVQSKRKHIVDKLMPNGKIPEDRTQASILLAALDGLDRSAIARKRIKSDSKNAGAMGNAAAIVAMMLNKIGNTPKEKMPVFDVTPPSLPNDVPGIEILPGETEIGTKNISYDEIMGEATDPE